MSRQPRNRAGCLAAGVLLGCLGTIGLATLVCAGGGGAMYAYILNVEPVAEAVEMAQEDQRVVARLGSFTNGMFNGTLTDDNGKGYADLIVPLYGRKGDAELLIEAGSLRGRWTFREATITFEDGSSVDLLEDEGWDDDYDDDEDEDDTDE